jgi:hypothetical protein
MATVINNPNAETSSAGWSTAIIVLAIIVLGLLAFFAFGHFGSGANNGSAAPQINVPVNLGGGSDAGTGGGADAGGGAAQ